MSTDPLLRATAEGDTACPDGQALAALGRSVRDASALPRPVDLVAGVMSRLDAVEHRAADLDLDDETIDAFYDGDGRGPAELVNLSSLIRGVAQAPHPVDLGDRVRAQLNGSLRLSARRAIDLGSRWRVWSAVVAGHVAALLALAVYQFNTAQPPSSTTAEAPSVTTSGGGVGTQGRVDTPATPSQPAVQTVTGPAAWHQIPGSTFDLFAPRRTHDARVAALGAAGMADAAPTIAASLRWILASQDATTGRFGSASEGDRALAVHSLALLALLGEGLDDPTRAAATRQGLLWLADRQATVADGDSAADGMSLLALVEGALLTQDPALRRAAETGLAQAETVIPAQSGRAGFGGFVLLAYETAHQGGLSVPGRALETARRNLGRPMLDLDEDTGRLGIAAFSRFINARADITSTGQLLTELSRAHRQPMVDPSGRVDPLGWYFASLAVHEAGGAAWTRWSDGLRTALNATITVDGDRAFLPAAKARFAEAMPDGDLFATSAALLELQVPYRYLPIAH